MPGGNRLLNWPTALVALGIDYNIFLMTRVREEAIRRDARRGALAGLARPAG